MTFGKNFGKLKSKVSEVDIFNFFRRIYYFGHLVNCACELAKLRQTVRSFNTEDHIEYGCAAAPVDYFDHMIPGLPKLSPILLRGAYLV